MRPVSTYLGLCLQRVALVLFCKSLDDGLLRVFCFREKRSAEGVVHEDATPSPRTLVDRRAQLLNVRSFGVPEPAADKYVTRLAVDIVARIWALPACSGPGCRVVRLGTSEPEEAMKVPGTTYLVRCRILAESHISVDAEYDIFDRKLWDRFV